jgi:hypothetical protein
MPVDSWQPIVTSLLNRWKQNPDVEAVLLIGSCAQGAASPGSDIDLSVIIAPTATLNEPRLRIINGWPVETFTGTRASFESNFEHFHNDNTRIPQIQFATAQILFDRTGQAAAIQQTARDWLAKPRIPQDPAKTYWPKRTLWLDYNHLERIHRNARPDFTHAYHAYIRNAYSKYAVFLGQPVMEADRVHSYFTDPAARQRYLQEPFPDALFAHLFIAALTASNPSTFLDHARSLRDHTLHQMGGLPIDHSTLPAPPNT